MKVEQAFGPLLSDYEVLTLLQEQDTTLRAREANGANDMPNLMTIQFEATVTPEVIKQTIKALEPFQLTKAEKLQLINLCPRSLVDIYVLIEECEERFAEDQLEDMLTIIGRLLPPAEETMDTEPGVPDEGA
ncbi:hypothetical protein H4R34_000533 [Dimargaris verticillata]|uniref:DNA-directed RNA polymerase III subunit RPC9 n=1 Tax=Dimargaris verticillata TaxID=2761393 RepID=A0A9W8EEM2_9FUNG|nr:hypothetical protein H4R34_000533 [Dimargaris verticillata]